MLQKTAKKAFEPEAQKFIDKAIYAKIPGHVKKIFIRAYLEEKPHNDIVLHLERVLLLNGLGAPDGTTLIPLKAVDIGTPELRRVRFTFVTPFLIWDIGILGRNLSICRLEGQPHVV